MTNLLRISPVQEEGCATGRAVEANRRGADREIHRSTRWITRVTDFSSHALLVGRQEAETSGCEFVCAGLADIEAVEVGPEAESKTPLARCEVAIKEAVRLAVIERPASKLGDRGGVGRAYREPSGRSGSTTGVATLVR